jgi:uncharacterized membrane protein (UPF0127 family)
MRTGAGATTRRVHGIDVAQVNTLRNVTRGTIVAARVTTARSLWARFRGLMGRASLDGDDALWLPGTNGIHMLFMRFPIDCAFLGAPDPDGTMPVISTRASLAPWTGVVWFVKGASGVLELPAGSLARTGTTVGDRVALAAESHPAGATAN